MTAAHAVGAQRTFMVTWGIGEEFGGMTAVCLQRARMFQQYAGQRTPILTFEPRPGYASVMRAVAAAGHAFEGLEILNIYHHLRSAPLTERAVVPGATLLAAGPPHGASTQDQTDDDGRVFCRVSTMAHPGKDSDPVVRREYLREDGETVLIDETQLGEDGEAAQRRLSLVAPDGRIVGSWSRPGDFYRDWLRVLAASELTAMIVDSNFAGGLVAQLEEANIVKFKVLHNSHVGDAADPFTGAIAGPHRAILDNPARWDGIVFLTAGQREDFVARFGPADNLFVISNPRERLPELPPFERRRSSRGVMVCQLSRRKNVESAIRVVNRARRVVSDLHLDVYGGGPQMEALQSLVDALGVHDHLTLHGYTAQAAQAFETATFSMLTSRKEGQSLVLMESLCRGCPPIAYDIRYGPSSLIEDGNNGFIVPEGDEAAAADRVVQLCRDAELARSLGAAAWRSSSTFGEEAVLDAWQGAIERAFEAKPDRLLVHGAAFAMSSMSVLGSGTLEIEGDVTWAMDAGSAADEVIEPSVVVRRRRNGAPTFVPVEVLAREPHRMSVRLRITQSVANRGVPEGNQQLDLVLALHGRNLIRHLRIDFGGGDEGWLPYSTVHGALSVQRRHRTAGATT